MGAITRRGGGEPLGYGMEMGPDTALIGIAETDLGAFRSAGLPAPLGLMALALEEGEPVLCTDGETQAIARPPYGMIGLAAASDAGARALAEIGPALETRFALGLGAPLTLGAPVPRGELLGWVAACLAERQLRADGRAVALMGELAGLRQMHDEMQTSFRALESFVLAAGLPERVETGTLPPEGAAVTLGAGGASEIVQTLPVGSAGLSDVAVHIAEPPSGEGGVLKLALETVEDGAVAARWTVGAAEIRRGWLRLGLGRALGPDQQTPRLSVVWEGDGAAGLSLSVKHPDPDWCAMADGVAADRVLALKSWAGIPGTAAHAAPQAAALWRGGAGRWLAGADLLRSVTCEAGEPDSVRFVADESGVLVHPSGTTPTIARLERAVPKGARHVWASVRTAHPEAAPVDYAIAVLPSDAAPARRTKPEFRREFSSDWVTLPADTKGEVHLFLPAPLSAPGDLYLATRLGEGVSNAFAWSIFSRIRAEGAAGDRPNDRPVERPVDKPGGTADCTAEADPAQSPALGPDASPGSEQDTEAEIGLGTDIGSGAGTSAGRGVAG